MIFVTGYGQMCNNILQFGHVYAWGRNHGVRVIGLRFCYKYRYFAAGKHRGYHFLTYLLAKYGARLGCIRKVSFDQPSSMSPDAAHLLLHSRFVMLEGWYMRDYDAFLQRREEIARLFSFKDALRRKTDAALPPLPPHTVRLGVHIRRGDYRRWMNGKYFFSDEDYIRVIRSFVRNLTLPALQIILVGNDPSIRADTYRKALSSDNIYLMRGNAGEDLYALSTCHYIMGPPSTFSLVAAFYHDAPLYWIMDKTLEVEPASFRKFDSLFRHIL
ncbi:MAG: alpha-1,2-fucosyltransferase [Tannerella sp.]|jgi:hypothetical protein|nr:alpha-1,2-fucosyltransferase [Tannerella sp.]